MEAKYVQSGGQYCLFCGSDNLDAATVEADGATAYSNVFCNDCKKEWTDEYKLVAVTEFFEK